MSAPGSHRRRPDVAALVIAALLAGLSLLIFWQTKAMPAAGAYARVGPTTAPYVIAGFLALLAIGHVDRDGQVAAIGDRGHGVGLVVRAAAPVVEHPAERVPRVGVPAPHR